MIRAGSMGEARQLAWWTFLVMVLVSVAFAMIAYFAGQDANWDFYNYHFYNAYAFLNDRFWFDIQPAQRQSNVYPFLDIPFYWLTQAFNVVVASLSYAVVQSWQAPAVFILTYLLLDSLDVRRGTTIVLSLALTALAVFSPLNLQLAGATTGDSTTAPLVLWALCCFMLARSRLLTNSSPRLITGLFILAGLLAGMAVGFKLTNGPFAVALALLALTPGAAPLPKFRILLFISLACLAGFLLAYGYWGWFLYSEFQNPLFPTFNHVFQSGFMKPVQLNDETFKATTVSGVVFYPFLYNAYTGAFNYQQFLDLRIPVLYLMVVLVLFALVFSRQARQRFLDNTLCSGLVLFCLASYLIWIQLFSITRYLLVLEVLTPLLVVAAAYIALPRRWPVMTLVAVALLPVVVSSWAHSQRENAFGYRSEWADTVFEIDFPDLEIDDSMVLITGGQAMAFLIPSAPQNTRFVRIDSNLNYVGYTSVAERYDNLMGERLSQEIGSHDGDFFIIYADGEEKYVGPDLAYFGIEREEQSCEVIRSKGPELNICRASRSGGAAD